MIAQLNWFVFLIFICQHTNTKDMAGQSARLYLDRSQWRWRPLHPFTELHWVPDPAHDFQVRRGTWLSVWSLLIASPDMQQATVILIYFFSLPVCLPSSISYWSETSEAQKGANYAEIRTPRRQSDFFGWNFLFLIQPHLKSFLGVQAWQC